MDDIAALKAAVTQSPKDAGAAGALFDALQESGMSAAKARRAVNEAIREANPIHWPAPMLRKLLRGTSLEKLQDQLRAANGRRRVRTLDIEDVLRTMARASKCKGAAWCRGESVANAYGYPAYRTACVAVTRRNGTIRVAIGEVSASKGTSPTRWATGLNVDEPRERFQFWANSDLPRVAAPAAAEATA